MLGDWTGSQGSGESGAKSVSIEAAFSYYDKDKSGTIDPSEFALLLGMSDINIYIILYELMYIYCNIVIPSCYVFNIIYRGFGC